MTQGVQEQGGRLPAVEAERHLVQVRLKVLGADTVPRPDDAALEQRESRFHGVGMNVSVNVYLRLMFNSLVFFGEGGVFESGRVGIQFVGHDHFNIFADIIANVLRESPGLNVLSVEESKIAATLPNAHHDLFVGVAISGLAVGVLFSADVSFVYFDGATHQGAVNLLHSGSDAMAEIPCGLVADSQGALHLVCGESLPSFHHEHHGHKPLAQGKVRVTKDRPSGHGELIFASRAPKQLDVRRKAYDALGSAPWALWAVRPTQPLQDFAAFVIGRKQFSEFRESHREHPV